MGQEVTVSQGCPARRLEAQEPDKAGEGTDSQQSLPQSSFPRVPGVASPYDRASQKLSTKSPCWTAPGHLGKDALGRRETIVLVGGA
jgi:hypothetical protein